MAIDRSRRRPRDPRLTRQPHRGGRGRPRRRDDRPRRRPLGRVHRRVRGGRAARRRRPLRRQGRREGRRRRARRDRPGAGRLRGLRAAARRPALLDLDGTPNKAKLGANAILGVSLAVARAAADSADLPLFRYVGGPNAHLLPVPMMNILNGGAHADTGVDVQEFMVAPIGAPHVPRGAAAGRRGLPRAEVGAEGARAWRPGSATRAASHPTCANNREALDLIAEAVEKAGLHLGDDIVLALDVAATEF